MALAKVLHFNLLPSAFQDEPALEPVNPEEEGTDGDEPPVREVG